jgi:hypothetical protein
VGARKIWRWWHDVENSGDLRIFVGLASELEDHPEDRAHLEELIVDEATELLHRPGPRIWIKLMAANGGPPLSRSVGSGSVDIDAASLPISVDLLSGLWQWDADHSTVLCGWPSSGGFTSATEAEQIVERGQGPVSRLQSELGPGYNVEYMPEPIRPPGLKLRAQ